MKPTNNKRSGAPPEVKPALEIAEADKFKTEWRLAHDRKREATEQLLHLWEDGLKERERAGMTVEQKQKYEDKIEALKKEIVELAQTKAGINEIIEEDVAEKVA